MDGDGDLQEARQALRDGRYDVAMLAIGRAALRLRKGDKRARRRLVDLAELVVEKAMDRTVVH